MCGIVGYISRNGRPIDKNIFEKMTDSLDHRGPDDRGIWHSDDGYASLGHRRLSIIDLSPAGHQPMSNENGTIWIIFNGEIYNFKGGRETLEKRGYQFRSKTDTEVIIHAYEEWGEKCLDRFNGMFAFAIYDSSSRRLFGARDRLGVKPFYYYAKNGIFLFASEIKAILASGLVEVSPDYNAIYTPTRFQISPYTGFKDIFKLPPAHYFLYEEGKLTIRRYWDIPVSENEAIPEERAADELDELLSDAVRLQMVADVPVGVFLSGGL